MVISQTAAGESNDHTQPPRGTWCWQRDGLNCRSCVTPRQRLCMHDLDMPEQLVLLKTRPATTGRFGQTL